MWYFIIGTIIALCVFILCKAYNKKASFVNEIETPGIIFVTGMSLALWPITILIGIGIICYKRYLKENFDKLTDWLSEKLFE